MQRLFEYVENDEVRRNIKDFLLQHIPAAIPRNADNYNRTFDCITGFAFGSSAFDTQPLRLIEEEELVQVTKHIFRHGDEDLRCLTMVFHAEDSDIVILHIRTHDAQQQGVIKLQDLNINGNNVHVREVLCTLNDQLELDIDLLNDLGLYHDYHNRNINNFLNGDLVQVHNAENAHGISERVMNNGWQDVGQHQELFRAISRVLMPENMHGNTIIGVDIKDKFRSILHGAFYASNNPYKMLTRYKIGQTYSFDMGREEGEVERVRTRVTEQTLDLLLLKHPTENDLDTHPIGYVLRFANNVRVVDREQRNAR